MALARRIFLGMPKLYCKKKLRDHDLLGHYAAYYYATALYRYNKQSMHGIPEHFNLHAWYQAHGDQSILEPTRPASTVTSRTRLPACTIVNGIANTSQPDLTAT